MCETLSKNVGRPLPPRPGGVAAGVAMGDLGAKARFKRALTGADVEPTSSSAPKVRRGPLEVREARFGTFSNVRSAD